MNTHEFFDTRCLHLISRWLKDKSGNVAMMFGLSIVPIMIAMGVGIDLSHQSRVQQKLAGTVDAIALASAHSHKDTQNRMDVGQKFLDANLSGDYGPGVQVGSLNVDFDDAAEIVTVSMDVQVPTLMMGIAGIHHLNITTNSKVSYEGHIAEPVSLGLVLDVSGSMRWNGKINTLKTAATRLLDKLAAADPDDVYVRTGLVSYSTGLRDVRTMNWGSDHTRPVVQALFASGGTASTPGVSAVGGWLQGNNEQAHHEQQEVHEGEEFELHRFMIFMTDGDNNRRTDDRITKNHCDRLKRDGIEIFSVAFEAPSRGRDLLEHCASSDAHYFDAQDSAEFLAAFDEIGDRIESALLRIVE